MKFIELPDLAQEMLIKSSVDSAFSWESNPDSATALAASLVAKLVSCEDLSAVKLDSVREIPPSFVIMVKGDEFRLQSVKSSSVKFFEDSNKVVFAIDGMPAEQLVIDQYDKVAVFSGDKFVASFSPINKS